MLDVRYRILKSNIRRHTSDVAVRKKTPNNTKYVYIFLFSSWLYFRVPRIRVDEFAMSWSGSAPQVPEVVAKQDK